MNGYEPPLPLSISGELDKSDVSLFLIFTVAVSLNLQFDHVLALEGQRMAHTRLGRLMGSMPTRSTSASLDVYLTPHFLVTFWALKRT